MSYSRNDALIADTSAGVDNYAAAAGPLLKQNTVSDPICVPVYERIDGLPNLPTGYAHARRADAVQPDLRPQPARRACRTRRIDSISRRWSG